MDTSSIQHSINLKVKLLNGRKAYMKVSLDQPVQAIRHKLAEGKHLPENGNYNLVFQGTLLEDKKYIRDYTPFLADGAVIMCVSKPDF